MVPDYRLDTTLVKKIIHAFRPAVAFGYLEHHITVYMYSKNINLDWVLNSYSTLEPSSRISSRPVPTPLDQGSGRSWGAKGRCPACYVVSLGPHRYGRYLKTTPALVCFIFRRQALSLTTHLGSPFPRKSALGILGELVERLLLE